MNSKLIVGLVVLIPSLVALSGCARSSGSETSPKPHPTHTAAAKPHQPVKIAIMLDKSASSTRRRVQQLAADDFHSLLDLLRRSGGEIAVGLISDDSNRSLLRLRLESPPVEPVLTLSEPDMGEVDVYEAAKRKKENNALRQKFAEDHARWVQAKEAWASTAESAIKHFSEELKKLLAVKPAYLSSDIWGAVGRADLFLSEDDAATWSKPPNRYLVLITDGEHNTGKSPVSLKSQATVLMSNGASSLGSLGPLNLKMFESPQPAFLHITTLEGDKE